VLPDLPTALLLLAAVPAVCEEVAFRGYILSGLERGRRTGSAIVLSALLFGFLHVLLSLFQQLFNATLLGLVLGLLAVRSGSLLPGIVFHFLNNALALVAGALVADERGRRVASWIYRDPGPVLYHWHWSPPGPRSRPCCWRCCSGTRARPPARPRGRCPPWRTDAAGLRG
jgi:sodium transport system permease protein